MEDVRFHIHTTMEKEDYRKFLYIATFRRNPLALVMVGAIAVIASVVMNLDSMNLTKILMTAVLLFIISIGVVCLSVERKNKARLSSDNTGAFGSINSLKFYEDRLVMENEAMKSVGELRYDQFFSLLEHKDYFIFYITQNQASLVRKKDVKELEQFGAFLREIFQGKYKRI